MKGQSTWKKKPEAVNVSRKRPTSRAIDRKEMVRRINKNGQEDYNRKDGDDSDGKD